LLRSHPEGLSQAIALLLLVALPGILTDRMRTPGLIRCIRILWDPELGPTAQPPGCDHSL